MYNFSRLDQMVLAAAREDVGKEYFKRKNSWGFASYEEAVKNETADLKAVFQADDNIETSRPKISEAVSINGKGKTAVVREAMPADLDQWAGRDAYHRFLDGKRENSKRSPARMEEFPRMSLSSNRWVPLAIGGASVAAAWMAWKSNQTDDCNTRSSTFELNSGSEFNKK